MPNFIKTIIIFFIFLYSIMLIFASIYELLIAFYLRLLLNSAHLFNAIFGKNYEMTFVILQPI